MPRVYLDIPFRNKDYAKGLGARWDNLLKTWYIPDGMEIPELAHFVEKPPKLEEETIFKCRANQFVVMLRECSCWLCSATTSVCGIVLPSPWQHLFIHVSPDACPEVAVNPCLWVTNFDPMIPTFISDLPISIEEMLVRLVPTFYHDFSSTAGFRYRMNHCRNCGAKIGDGKLHESGGVFNPLTIEAYEAIKLIQVRMELRLNGTTAFPTPIAKNILQLSPVVNSWSAESEGLNGWHLEGV
jgi:hypothetical protein